MTYYADLTPYEYLGPEPGVLNVGWLEASHPFAVAEANPELIRRLATAARYSRVNQTRGYHPCSICGPGRAAPYVRVGWRRIHLGSAELRVRGADVTYAAPDLVVHYIRDHGYAPPQPFVDAAIKPVRARSR